MRELTTQDEVDELLQSPGAVLLKHGAHCPVSAAAREEIARLEADHPDARVAGIEVTGNRALSDYVAERLGIPHASPEVFVVADGAVRWHVSHREIRMRDIATQVDRLGNGAGRGRV